jgi:hypothetical protein
VRFGVADAGFTKQFAPGGGDHIDPSIPAANLALLTSVAQSVKVYVDQHVAHNDASWLSSSLPRCRSGTVRAPPILTGERLVGCGSAANPTLEERRW